VLGCWLLAFGYWLLEPVRLLVAPQLCCESPRLWRDWLLAVGEVDGL
jgi:hypothetical protein